MWKQICKNSLMIVYTLDKKGSVDADIQWNAAWLGFPIFHNWIAIDLDL